MAVIRWNFPDGAHNDTLTPVLAGADTVNLTGGSGILSNEQALAGGSGLSAKFSLVTTGHLWFAKEGLSATSYAYDVYLYISTRMGGDIYVGWAGASSSARSLGVIVSATNGLTLNDSAGAVWQGVGGALPDNTWIRIAVFGTCGVGTGTARVAWFLGHDTAPQEDSGLLSNLSTQASVNRIRIGGKAASSGVSAGVSYIGSWAYDTTATDLLAPYGADASAVWYRRDTGIWVSIAARQRVSGSWQTKSTHVQ